MNLEKIYLKLPEFIKYNPKILKLSLKISNRFNNRSSQLDSQSQLLNLLLTCCDIKMSGPRRSIQLLYIELLRFIDNVCKKHDIDYWLEFGTLLGAVRHGGFIPWDDDIDLGILREDYNKLIQVLPQEISKYDGLKDNCGLTLLLENEKDYFEDFQSVFDVKDKYGNIKDNYKLNFLQIAWLKPYVKIDFFPMDFIIEDRLEDLKKNFVSKKYKFHFDIANGDINFFEELEKRKKEVGFTNSKTKYFGNSFESIHYNPIRIFEYDKTFPLTSIKFDDYEFKSPIDPDSHLKESFGDNYMDIPKIIESHDLLPFIRNQFNSNDEMEKAFSEAIQYLKEINDNF